MSFLTGRVGADIGIPSETFLFSRSAEQYCCSPPSVHVLLPVFLFCFVFTPIIVLPSAPLAYILDYD